MTRTGESYYYEAMSMVQYILEGHNVQETANEFRVSKETVRRRLRKVGHTYVDLVEKREKGKKRTT